MADSAVKLELDVEFGEKLKKLERKAVTRALEKSVKKTGLETEKRVKANAPYDTGNLRRSISLRHANITGFEIWAAYYWAYLNYGTSKMNAQPFITEFVKMVPMLFQKNLHEQLKEEGVI